MKPLNHTHSFHICNFFQNRLNLFSRNRDPNLTQNEHVHAICCRPEKIAGYVICGENVKTIQRYAVLNFEASSFSSFRDIKNPFVTTAAAANVDDSIKKHRNVKV